MPSPVSPFLYAALAVLLYFGKHASCLNATAWGSIGRAAPGAYLTSLALNITVGTGYIAPAEPYILKSGVGIIINFCASSGKHSFMAPELFKASFNRRVQVADLGYAVGDVISGCVAGNGGCCSIYFTPAIAGTYTAVDLFKRNVPNAVVATITVVDQVAAETIEQVTRPGWVEPVVGDLATLKAGALAIKLAWVNETDCPGNDGTLNLKYRYSGGHTGVAMTGPTMVDPAANPVQMLAGKGYVINYEQFLDNAEAYLSAIEFYSQAYTEVTFRERGKRAYATVVYVTYPQHIELFAYKSLASIFAVPTTPGLYPFTNRHDPAVTYPGIFQVLNPLSTFTVRDPKKITTVEVPTGPLCLYQKAPDCPNSISPQVLRQKRPPYNFYCNTYQAPV